MKLQLNPTEVRVLGSLVEKETTTPEYYPLTIKALQNACNQKSNRYPVVFYDEATVLEQVERLRSKGLVLKVSGGGSRVLKYRHILKDAIHLSRQQMALLGGLMLRGPQTIGELRGRAERMYHFEKLEEVETIIDEMINEDPPLVIKLARKAGRKEHRYMHLLAGEPKPEDVNGYQNQVRQVQPAPPENVRIEALEKQLTSVKNDLEKLINEFSEFKKQFE